MYLSQLLIQNLRNLKQVELAPGPAVNLLHGANGAGKTTVLESLFILAKGRSFRGGRTSSLIGPDARHYLIRATLIDDREKTRTVGLQRSHQGWEGRLDGQPLRQLSDTATLFPIILMEPTTLQLISGGPDARRRYLDWTVFHVKHDYLAIWRRYNQALKQRNAALRMDRLDVVRSLDPQLVRFGESLAALRLEIFEDLSLQISEKLRAMREALSEAELSLHPGWSGESLAASLDEDMERDRESGQTRSGPHRSDIVIRLEGKAVRERLSRGELKVFAAAMCLAQAELFHVQGRNPILLLDDLASELDSNHLRRVVDTGLTLGAQLFITGTDRNNYGFLPEDDCAVFHVKQGDITPQ